jgi:hypothetical protein
MRPATHMATSCLAVAAVALWEGMPPAETAAWCVLAAAATLAIDLDHFAIQYLDPRRRHVVAGILRDPLGHVDVKKLICLLHYPGFGILRMKAHVAQSAAATAVMLYFGLPYSQPVLVSLWVHVAADAIELITDPRTR